MSPGVALFLGILLGVSMLAGAQWAMARKTKALEGEAVPALPDGFAKLANDDTVLWFHSPTCGPCKAMHPIVDDLVTRGRAHSIDVSQHLEVARAFGVMATPTTIRLRQGRVVAVRTGGMSPQALEAFAV